MIAMISVKAKGSFDKTYRFFTQAVKGLKADKAESYASKVIAALEAATPVDSGLTSKSWTYKIERTGRSVRISFYNTNINDGVSIALLLQYGHAARDGRWIPGIDYINPAVKPIFDKARDAVWKEVVRG